MGGPNGGGGPVVGVRRKG